MTKNTALFLLRFGQIVRIVGCLAFLMEVLFWPTAEASILVRPVLTQEARLQVHLQKQRSGNQSFVEYWRSKNPSPEKVTELQTLFEEAQRTLLKDGPTVAKPKYKEVTELALTSDWKSTDREIIFQSFLRLASFENEHTKKMQYFAQAFSLDWDLKVDKEVFSPALEKEYAEFRSKQQKEFQIWRPAQSPDIQVFINGKKIDSAKINLSPGTKRITLVSNAHLPHTVLMDPETLKRTRIRLESLITGTCGAAKWNYQDAESSNFVAVFDSCLEDYDGKTVSLFESESKSTPSAASIQFPAELPNAPLYKKPLFWVVTGAIVVGAVLLFQKNQEANSKTPTHSEGM